MDRPIKILHIDTDYNVNYFVNLPGALIRTPVTLKKSIHLLNTEKFDLILFERENKAILTPQENEVLLFPIPSNKVEKLERNLAF